jgi:hypothetical protein
MGVTTTPINGFTLPDDNELLRNVYSHVRNHANQLEAALRSRGLTSADVTGYLDLVGRVNTVEAAVGVTAPVITPVPLVTTGGVTFRQLGVAGWSDGAYWTKQGRAGVQGTVVTNTALTANTAYSLSTALPVSARPGGTQKLPIACYTGTVETTANLLVLGSGVLQVVPAVNIAAGGSFGLSGDWWVGL